MNCVFDFKRKRHPFSLKDKEKDDLLLLFSSKEEEEETELSFSSHATYKAATSDAKTAVADNSARWRSRQQRRKDKRKVHVKQGVFFQFSSLNI